MKLNAIIFTIFYLFYIINSSNTDLIPYSRIASDFLSQYTDNIVGVKSKTNKTKCYANKDVKVNDIIFEYKKKEIISSETCFHPQKNELIKNISLVSKDTFEHNQFLLAFCLYYVFQDPDSVEELDRKVKFYIITLPVFDIQKNEVFLNKSNLDKLLIKEYFYSISDQNILNQIIKNNFEIENKASSVYILFSKIYYYIKTHSFNINNHAVILPFIDICDVVPYYLSKPKIYDLSDSYTVEEYKNKIFVKSKINIQQSDPFLFSYNLPLDNDYLFLKRGIIIHNNLYDKYIIYKKITFKDNSFTEELLNNLKQFHINQNSFEISKDNNGKDLEFKFILFANKISEILYKFGQAYFSWWRKSSNNKYNLFGNIDNQIWTFIVRICYDEIKSIQNKIKINFDEDLKANENGTISQVTKFNLEKMNVLFKNINYTYKYLILSHFNEIKNQKIKYIPINNQTNVI